MELIELLPVPPEKKTLKQILSDSFRVLTSGFTPIFLACLPCIALYAIGDFLMQTTSIRLSLGQAGETIARDVAVSIVWLLLSLFLSLYLFSLAYTLISCKARSIAPQGKSLIGEALLRYRKALLPYGLSVLLAIVTAPVFFYTYIPLFLYLVFSFMKRGNHTQGEELPPCGLKESFRIGTRYWARLFGAFFVICLLALLCIFLTSMPQLLAFLAQYAANSYTAHSGIAAALPGYYSPLLLSCSLIKGFFYCFAALYAGMGCLYSTFSLLVRRRGL